MANTFRALWQNFGFSGQAVLTASSEQSGYSVNWVKHQSRSKVWRSAVGWSFVKGFNDVLRFGEGSDERIAYVDGEYSTGDLASAAIESAMDAAGLDPLDLSPSLWLKADALQLEDGASVTAWADSSGNGNDLDNTVGTQTYYRSGLNGRPVVRFEDDGYLFADASAVQMDDLLDGSGRGSIFVVAWVDADHTAYDALWSQGAGAATRGMYVDSSDDLLCRAYDGSQDDATLAGTAGGWHLYVWQYDGTNVSAFIDDCDDAAANTTASGSQTSLTDDFRLGGDATNDLKGFIAEVIVIPGDITEENHRRIAYYLAQKYGLTDVTDDTTAPSWGNTYAVSYGGSTKKFTLARDTGSSTFDLPWTEAAYAGRTMGEDLGFDVTGDDTGATTYTADNAAYQSRHWIEVDLGDTPAIKAAVVINHNSGTTANTHIIQANDEPFWEDTPDYEGTLAAANDPERIRLLFFSQQNKQYWRFLINDVQNTDGYGELGIVWLSSYFQPTRPHRQGLGYPREELSEIGYSDHGAPFFDDKPTVHGWDLEFAPVIESDKNQFKAMFDYVKRSRCFFVALDAATTPDDTWYVFLPSGGNIDHMAGEVWSVDMKVARAPL